HRLQLVREAVDDLEIEPPARPAVARERLARELEQGARVGEAGPRDGRGGRQLSPPRPSGARTAARRSSPPSWPTVPSRGRPPCACYPSRTSARAGRCPRRTS